MVLEEVGFPSCSSLCGRLDERLEEAFGLLRLAVIGVQRNQYVVLLSQSMRSLRQHDASIRSVLIRQP